MDKIVELLPRLLKQEGVYITDEAAKQQRLYHAWKREHQKAMDARDGITASSSLQPDRRVSED